MKEETESYLSLFKTNMENYKALDKTRKKLRKVRVKQKQFFEWLENSGLLIESFESEYRKYCEKKEALLTK